MNGHDEIKHRIIPKGDGMSDQAEQGFRAHPSGVPFVDMVKRCAEMLGYRFEISDDGCEERCIRPDGTIAIIARRARERSPHD